AGREGPGPGILRSQQAADQRHRAGDHPADAGGDRTTYDKYPSADRIQGFRPYSQRNSEKTAAFYRFHHSRHTGHDGHPAWPVYCPSHYQYEGEGHFEAVPSHTAAPPHSGRQPDHHAPYHLRYPDTLYPVSRIDAIWLPRGGFLS